MKHKSAMGIFHGVRRLVLCTILSAVLAPATSGGAERAAPRPAPAVHGIAAADGDFAAKVVGDPFRDLDEIVRRYPKARPQKKLTP
jgi:hypothetical protein